MFSLFANVNILINLILVVIIDKKNRACWRFVKKELCFSY